MLKYIKTLLNQPFDARACKSWKFDPLSHPDVRQMTLDQLADLPFDRTRNRAGPSNSEPIIGSEISRLPSRRLPASPPNHDGK